MKGGVFGLLGNILIGVIGGGVGGFLLIKAESKGWKDLWISDRSPIETNMI
jgi:uncharacterized membrane protein YeaQ/YmgE (transglycosylase-associated protein family)